MYAKKGSLAGIVRWWTLMSSLFLGLTAASGPVQADVLYAGVNYGNTKMKDKSACGTAGLVLSPGYTCSLDDKDNGWKLLGGFEFMENVAVELSYANFGKATASASGSGVTASSDLKAKGFTFAFVGTLPVTKEFGLIGRIGTYRWNVESSASTSSGTSISRKDTKPGFTFDNIGIGLKYSINKIMDVRMEWERFKDVGNTLLTGQSDIDFLSIGLVYKFQ